MDKRDEAILKKVIEEAKIITEMIADFDCNTFITEEKTKRAVCMALINIGEMVKLLSEQTKQRNPSIPWKSIAGLRDVTAHGYQTLRMEDIWVTATEDIPALQEQIKGLLTLLS